MSFVYPPTRRSCRDRATGAMTRVLRGLAALMAAGATALAAQERAVDGGSFAIIRGSDVVGIEEFQIRRHDGAAGIEGYTISATAVYPPDRPTHVLTAVVRFGGDSVVSTARFETQESGASGFALVTVGNRRVTVRIRMPGRESTREYPGAAFPVLLDDSLFGIHALLVPPSRTALGLVWARAGQGGPGTAVFHGTATTDLNGERRSLDHVSLHRGQVVRHLWFDGEGRLQKVEAPDVGLIAVRRP